MAITYLTEKRFFLLWDLQIKVKIAIYRSILMSHLSHLVAVKNHIFRFSVDVRYDVRAAPAKVFLNFFCTDIIGSKFHKSVECNC